MTEDVAKDFELPLEFDFTLVLDRDFAIKVAETFNDKTPAEVIAHCGYMIATAITAMAEEAQSGQDLTNDQATEAAECLMEPALDFIESQVERMMLVHFAALAGVPVEEQPDNKTEHAAYVAFGGDHGDPAHKGRALGASPEASLEQFKLGFGSHYHLDFDHGGVMGVDKPKSNLSPADDDYEEPIAWLAIFHAVRVGAHFTVTNKKPVVLFGPLKEEAFAELFTIGLTQYGPDLSLEFKQAAIN